MKTTDSGWLCSAVAFIGCVIFLAIVGSMMFDAIMANPGITQLINVLGGTQ